MKTLSCFAMKCARIPVLAVLTVVLFGCSEDETVSPPPPPPQINLVTYSTSNGLPSDDVYDVFVDSFQRIWFSTQNGVALFDGSQVQTFNQADGLSNPKTRSISEFNGKIWVSTWGGGVCIYNGTSWSTLGVSDGLLSESVFDIAVDDTSVWFATVGGISQYIDNDGIPMDERWINRDELQDVIVSSLTVVDSVFSGSSQPLNGIWGSSESDVFTIGDNGTIFHYDGTQWSAMASGTTVDLLAVWGGVDQNVFVSGKSGTILHYDGFAWSPMTSGTSEDLLGIWGSDDGMVDTVYCVGTMGTILRYDGADWNTVENTISTDTLSGVWGDSFNSVFIVGEDGTVLHYMEDLDSLEEMSSNTTGHLHSTWGTSESNVFAAGNGGLIIRYDGSLWSNMTSRTTNNLYWIWGSSENNIYAVGNKGTIVRYNGSSWNRMSNHATGNDLSGFWITSGHLFAVGGRAIIHRDGGIGWTPMTRGPEIWSGTKENGLIMWRLFYNSAMYYTESNSEIPASDVNDIDFDPITGLFWIALATEGVASVDIDNNTWTHYTMEDGLPSMITHSLDIDQNGKVWVGTQMGLAEWNGSGFIGYINGSGIPEERVRKVRIDNQGRVWLGFINGGAARVVQ